MELSSYLNEKLLNNECKFQEDDIDNKSNRIEYVSNIANIHRQKNFEEKDTDNYDFKKPLLNKNDKPKKYVKIDKPKNEDKKMKIFKLKVINHFLLVIFTIIQTLWILNPITTNLRSQERIFYNIFLENSSKENKDFCKVLYLYDIEDLKNHFKKTINNFFNLDMFLLNRVSFLRNYTVLEFFYFEDKYMDNLNRELFLTNQSLLNNDIINDMSNINENQDYVNPQDFINNKVSNYKVTNERFGPFALNNKSLKIFLNDVKYFRVHFKFQIYTLNEISGLEECNEWV